MDSKISTTYIHPQSKEIAKFAQMMKKDTESLKEIIQNVFQWFDSNITYSRLNAPYFPLQRSDLDLLSMKCGTCGDYSNLISSLLIHLGVSAKYAYLKKDCFGNEQDHICVAAKVDDRWILIDATLPYRKWNEYDCPHEEYELYEPDIFEEKLKKEERYWHDKAIECGNENFAGLFYAPWIHEEIVSESESSIESVFYLLNIERDKVWSIYVTYFINTPDGCSSPIMAIVNAEGASYKISINKAKNLWDDNQWSSGYCYENIPVELQSEVLKRFKNSIDKNISKIIGIIPI